MHRFRPLIPAMLLWRGLWRPMLCIVRQCPSWGIGGTLSGKTQQSTEQCYRFLSVCAVFSCVQTVTWLPVFEIFIVRTDVDACDCTRGLCGHRKRVCTGSWLWEKSPLLHVGLEPASVLHLAFRLDGLPTELSHPSCICFVRIVGPVCRSTLLVPETEVEVGPVYRSTSLVPETEVEVGPMCRSTLQSTLLVPEIEVEVGPVCRSPVLVPETEVNYHMQVKVWNLYWAWCMFLPVLNVLHVFGDWEQDSTSWCACVLVLHWNET